MPRFFFSVEMGCYKLFFGLGCPETTILLISAFHEAGMTGVNDHIQLLVEMTSHELFMQAGLELQSS
jgi:hypothetical protein